MYDLLGGYLLLCSRLGVTGRKPLNHKEFHQFLALDTDVRGAVGRKGCPKKLEKLIEDEALMQRYAKSVPGDIVPLILTDPRYPQIVKERLKNEAPGILWAKGNMELMDRPAIALVGSRKMTWQAQQFSEKVGAMAARDGFVLVSGNAIGSDTAAQDACLAAGGSVISVIADSLVDKKPHDRILYLAENDYDAPMNSDRALSRNNVIHSLVRQAFVAQSGWGRGGSYSGTYRNLKGGWSQVVMHSDGSEAAIKFSAMGATMMTLEEVLAL